VTESVESKQLEKNRESPSNVCVRVVSMYMHSRHNNEQALRLVFFERKRQSVAQHCDEYSWQETSEVVCIKSLLFEGVQPPKHRQKNPENALSDALLMPGPQYFASIAAEKKRRF